MTEHYNDPNLFARVEKALTAAGLPEKLSWHELTPIDQLHLGGFQAAERLAQWLLIRQGSLVLELGCGIGGACRYLAATYGCRVVGIDRSPSFVETARRLTERCGLSSLVAIQQADATSLPLENASFDIVWTQHASMNILAKDRLYEEIARVLKPGGQLGLHDIVGNQYGPRFAFPVPWAQDLSGSFLVSEDRLRMYLETAGLKVEKWQDVTAEELAWFERVQSNVFKTGLIPSVVMGSQMPVWVNNLIANCRAGLAKVITATCLLPDPEQA